MFWHLSYRADPGRYPLPTDTTAVRDLDRDSLSRRADALSCSQLPPMTSGSAHGLGL